MRRSENGASNSARFMPTACAADLLDLAISDDHRQAEELPSSPARDHAQCRASPEQGAEQPSGEFTSADEIAREGDEAVQVSASRSALPLSLRDITSFFRVGRHLCRAHGYRAVMKSRFAAWDEVVVAQGAA